MIRQPFFIYVLVDSPPFSDLMSAVVSEFQSACCGQYLSVVILVVSD